MVIAETNYGNVSAVSDGVTVVADGNILQDVLIRDGPPLFNSDHGGTNWNFVFIIVRDWTMDSMHLV